MFILFDLGYLLFYRLHATMRWVDFQKTIDASEDHIVKLFTEHLHAQLNKLKKKREYKDATMIFCKDERHSLVWRMSVYPEYKSTRGVATDLVRRLQGIVLDVVSTFGEVVGSAGLEADDCAYLTVKYIRQHLPSERIVVITSDRDYLQMTDDHVTLIDGSGKPVKGTGDAETDKWTKILMGDKSDNIPPVCKGCGKKTAEALARDPVQREAFIQQKKCSTEVQRNQLLVCMDQIPRDLVKGFFTNNATVLQKIKTP